MFGAVAELRAVAAFLAMYSDIPFWLSLVLMLGGLAVLAWSSDVFADGAAAVAKALGISPSSSAWKHPKWPGAIQRKEAWIWIVTFVGYTLLMFYQETH